MIDFVHVVPTDIASEAMQSIAVDFADPGAGNALQSGDR
jgi:hypothetical protein